MARLKSTKKLGLNSADVEMDDGDDEEDDEEEEVVVEEGDEFVDLVDILDGKVDDEDGGDAELSDQDSSSNSDSASEEEEKLNFDPSDDEEMPEALDHLNEFVSNLDVTSTKRKATEDPSEVGASTDTRARKRRLAIKERTEAGAENEFRARSSGNFIIINFVFILHLTYNTHFRFKIES